MRISKVAILIALAPSLAFAQSLDRIRVGDLPGTDGRWQAGDVTIAAPAADVQRWLADAGDWPKRFPDVEWTQPLGHTGDGRQIFKFRSRVIGRPLTLRMRSEPGLITYDGEGKDVTTQGRIYVEARGPNTTHVVLQTSAEVHGMAGAFASQKMKREKAIKKLTADLTALIHLERAWAATRRSGG